MGLFSSTPPEHPADEKFNSFTFKVKHVVGKMLTYAAVGGGVGAVGLGAGAGMFTNTAVGNSHGAGGVVALLDWIFNKGNITKDVAVGIGSFAGTGGLIGAGAGALAGLVHGLNTMNGAAEDARDELRADYDQGVRRKQNEIAYAMRREQYMQALQQQAQQLGLAPNMNPNLNAGLPTAKGVQAPNMGRYNG